MNDELTRLRMERDQLLNDVLWYASEFGVEHWRNCDDDDCYLCEGHETTRERALGYEFNKLGKEETND